MADQVQDNPSRKRFELSVEGIVAFVDYERREGGVFALTHTEVPEALGGKGVGSRLVKGSLELVRAQGGKVLPCCSFISAYVEKHPEYQDLLA